MRSLDLHREIGAEEIRCRWSIEEPPGIAERVKAISRHHRRNLDDPSPSNQEADPNPKSSEACCSTLLQNQNFPNPRSSLSLFDGSEETCRRPAGRPGGELRR
ncbi:hypothetical protein C1H46_022728 [Malus baccata]|uniref:Uncharacterized protein n=1 Tax=Malus baccata TaxID=106549 RepID=A0A540LYU9_MALBA|nr:hypothetical protein C1H46_022728 [Malus baccata]